MRSERNFVLLFHRFKLKVPYESLRMRLRCKEIEMRDNALEGVTHLTHLLSTATYFNIQLKSAKNAKNVKVTDI
jgi:hypothetical protein